ncbi:ArsR/SmtB family transcription factor [Nonomuraea spiralis]|uniref:ArsR/SmtB family transcription factor n=1 Tax=Nonomuraea spiralis TaxID=46182 RepID=A0ABV5IVM3_9ACTN|nr:winged helix-turn-helix domain-containing protein [Nonomuraea spiralis]GGS83929.1 transcriptional regulator [Nonomuraea spiralis]
MHRIHFTSDDLARVRVAPTLGPMAETLFSLTMLRGRSGEATFGAWRRRARAGLDSRHAILGAVLPSRGPSFDLVNLAGPGHEFAESAERFLSRSRHAVQAELDYYADHHGRVPAVLAGLVDSLAARREALATVEGYHRAAVAPHWARIHSHLVAERARRGTILLDHGVDGLLSSLHPDVRWAPPTLHVRNGDESPAELTLDGRGLLLVSSFFLRVPTVMYDPRCLTGGLLVYPATLDADQAANVWTTGTPANALADLLGRTRAAILTAIAEGVTGTGVLARSLDVSSAAISQHTAVLREAGLITTRRHHGGVEHHPTQIGLTLLDRHDTPHPAP